MKKAIRFALGLLLVLPIYASSGVGVPRATATTPKADNFYYAFAYGAVPQGNNVYSVTIYFLKVDQTNFTYTYVNTPQAIEITGNFPSPVTTFTFPSGVNSLYVGNLTFSSPPTQAYPISTNPSSVGGLSISTELTDLDIM
ncbi:MAG TPA: hypothetical protein VK518_02495 [Puia sp.]|nr:hypothetical protein [Puia sp.]